MVFRLGLKGFINISDCKSYFEIMLYYSCFYFIGINKVF